MKLSRRLFRVFAVLGLVAVTVLVSAPAASALLVCSPGLLPVGGVCINPATGGVSLLPGQTTMPAAVPRQVTLPSSELAGLNGVGGTTAQNIGGALANGSTDSAIATGGGKVLATRVLGVALPVAAAAYTGYTIGQQFAQWGCQWGASALCMPVQSSVGYIANADVVVGLDPGWTNGNIISVYSAGGGGPASADFTCAAVAGLVAGTLLADPWYYQPLITCTGNLGQFDTAGNGQKLATVGNASYFYDKNGVLGGGGAGGFITPTNATTFSIPGGSTLVPGIVDFPAGNSNGSGGVRTRYIFVGAAGRPPAQNSNPQRHWQVTDTCSGGAVMLATSASFYETDSVLPDMPKPAPCPAGQTLTRALVQEVAVGGVTKTIWDVTTPAAVAAAQLAYPGCDTGACRLDLVKIGPAGSRLGSCFGINDACAGWFTDVAKADNYQCTYGLQSSGVPVIVPLTECNVYSPTFDPLQQGIGTPIGDPATGAVPAPAPGGNPILSPEPNPVPGGVPLPVPVATPGGAGTGESSCFPSGWSAFNPLEWVYQPTKCALTWAFKPAAGAITDAFAGVQTAWTDSGPGRWAGYVGTVIGSTNINPGAGSCDGPPLTIGASHFTPAETFHPLAACASPMSVIAGIVKAILTVGLWLGTFFVAARAILGSMGIHVMDAFGRGSDGGEV